MKTWPKKFILELARQVLLITIAMVGMRTIIDYFLFNEIQTREDVIDSVAIGFIMAFVFIFFNGKNGKLPWKKFAMRKL